MSQILRDFAQVYCKAEIPQMEPGYLVEVHQKVKEGSKERVQIFEGTVIRVTSGTGIDSTFTVRKISEGVGVEKTFPTHSPFVIEVKVLRAHKVRRARLNYLKDLSGKALRMKEIPLKLVKKTFEGGRKGDENVVLEKGPNKDKKK